MRACWVDAVSGVWFLAGPQTVPQGGPPGWVQGVGGARGAELPSRVHVGETARAGEGEQKEEPAPGGARCPQQQPQVGVGEGARAEQMRTWIRGPVVFAVGTRRRRPRQPRKGFPGKYRSETLTEVWGRASSLPRRDAARDSRHFHHLQCRPRNHHAGPPQTHTHKAGGES